ncbi:DUF5719 family protein [Streptomyces sp. HSG2]|uniref:DUF5719 family protein n=1 Tax=Streptomyces sp. HSG2 TaxID=2797167 RepID=UPI001905A1BF|nr:DUF5719 family protein [Streptomyces sp. HSG2]
MRRTTLSFLGCVAALAVVTGTAAITTPGDAADDASAASATRLPVDRSVVLCPSPGSSDVAETTYTSFTPVTEGAEGEGAAELLPLTRDAEAGEGDEEASGEAVLEPAGPGTPTTGEHTGDDAPALLGTAEGEVAPGWSVGMTTKIAAGLGRGLSGLACGAPDTEFWFPGVGTEADRTDYVHLTNPDDTPAVVDITLYGEDGEVESELGEGITVPARATRPILLGTLAEERQTDLTAHVGVRSGRVGAAVLALDAEAGGDWLTASADPAARLVLPGIPKDATAVRLVMFTPGDVDADLDVSLASPTGPITPAGHETVRVKAGLTTAVDLGDITRGEAGSLVLTPTGGDVPVVAALRVTRGEGEDRETAFLPATGPIVTRATSPDQPKEGTTLYVTAPGETARVRITASAGSEGGEGLSREYTIEGGTTQDVDFPVPEGLKGVYALTVEPVSGGPVHASRTLSVPVKDVPAFTVQPLADDRGTVAVPDARQDLSVLVRR